jgi:hypothetical protein
MTIQSIEKEAAAIALKGGETKEQAYARLLQLHPEAYAEYRIQHNAKAVVETLRAAGVRLV